MTYYTNVLSRKLGYSLVEYDATLLSNHELAQALNLSEELGAKIEQSSEELIARIKESYMG